MTHPALELSGPRWVERFPTSAKVEDLKPPFQSYVRNFLNALHAAKDGPATHGHIVHHRGQDNLHPEHPPTTAEKKNLPHHVAHAPSHRLPQHHGIHVRISATYRPPERAYLMHYAHLIARKHHDPAKVPSMAGVAINWVHPTLEASRNAAEAMVRGYGIAYAPALHSRHTEGFAIDMTITWSATLRIHDSGGHLVEIASTPRTGAGNKQLHEVGATFGVQKLLRDPPHWSVDGH